ncbi:MAG: hypothetical protein IIA45_10985 [Bacteroidetes bacterium]|nr:hypothetical protein [Bacteroidota bacterium]
MKKASIIFLTLFLFPGLSNGQKLTGFLENKGQLVREDNSEATEVLYYRRTEGVETYLLKNRLSYVFRTKQMVAEEKENEVKTSVEEFNHIAYRIDVQLLGANNNSIIESSEEVTCYYENHYTSINTHGILGVKEYKRITYHDIYPDIDWIIYTAPNLVGIKYDFVVHPGGDISQIKLKYHGIKGISIIDGGSLNVTTEMGSIIEGAPEVYQNGKQLLASYSLENDQVSFEVKNYNTEEELIIDPQVGWATYYGGDADEIFFSVENDSVGNVIAVGYSNSNNFPVQAGHQSANAGSNDIVVVKFDANGNRLWSTYYGGSGSDLGFDVHCGKGNDIAISGQSSSSDFPVASAHQNTSGGGTDAVLIYFNAAGVRQWATYYGGINHDEGNGVAISTNGDVFLGGLAISNNNIGTAGTHAPNNYCCNTYDGFVAKFNSSGVRQWGTYAGGNSIDHVRDISVDNNGDVFTIGNTRSTNNIATAGALQTSYSGPSSAGKYNAYMMKFSGSNGTRLWGTYYGSSTASEVGTDAACDDQGNVYFTGSCGSGLSMLNAFQPTHAGSSEAFLIKFNSTGTRQWSTFVGGSGADLTTGAYTTNNNAGLDVDTNGHVYLSYSTTSTNLNLINPAQSSLGGGKDMAVFRFDANGIMRWSTLYGGSDEEICIGVTAIDSNNITIVGNTRSLDIPTLNAFQDSLQGGTTDAFIVQFGCPVTVSTLTVVVCSSYTVPSGNATLTVSGTYMDTIPNGSGCDSIITVNLTINNSVATINPTTCDSFIPPSGNYTWTTSGNYLDTIPNGSGCDSIITVNLTINNTPIDTITGPDSICTGNSATLSITGGISTLWSTGDTTTSIIVSPASDTSYSVIVNYSNNCIAMDTHFITVCALPGSVTIIGQTKVNAFQVVTYSVTQTTGSTYQWFVTGGNIISSGTTNSVTIQWATAGVGNVSVVEVNSCGCISIFSSSLEIEIFSGIDDLYLSYIQSHYCPVITQRDSTD